MTNRIDLSTGRYWDRPWSLVDGCTPCSPGCDHCWAARWAHRFLREGEPGHNTPILTEYDGPFIHEAPQFNGVVMPRYDRLDIPLRRRKPTVYSVWNDLFHEEDVPDEFRDAAYAVMALCKQHTFLVLTKRFSEMAIYWHAERVELGLRWFNARRYSKDCKTISAKNCGIWPETGFPNVYHGLTVVTQQEADEKIPVFLQVPGKKFLSIEPMLGAIDLAPWWLGGAGRYGHNYNMPQIDAVILGGETGPGARPMDPDWVRSVRDQCAAAGIPFFFKQWGEWWQSGMGKIDALKNFKNKNYDHRSGMFRIGGKAAGRLLDGLEHNDLPWVTL